MGDGAGPAVDVVGDLVEITLNSTLNSTLGSETTIPQMVDAVNQHGQDLVIAEVIPADLTAADPQLYSPIQLSGGIDAHIAATLTSDFWTAGGVLLQFEAKQSGEAGNNILVLVHIDDPDAPVLSPGDLPLIEVDDAHPDHIGYTVITITLNVLPGSQTTAEQLIEAVNNDHEASALVDLTLLSAPDSQYTGLVTPRIVRHVVSSGTQYPLGPLTGGGDLQATASSTFGTSLEIQFTANEDNYSGALGNDISIVVQREDLGDASAEPQFEIDPLDPDRLIIKLNTNSDNPTSVDDLLQALAVSPIASEMVDASLIGSDSTPIGTGAAGSYGLTFSEAFDFGTQGLVVMEFTTIDLNVPGGRYQLQFNKADLGDDGTPEIIVLGSKILVTLDTDDSNGGDAATTAQQLIDALNDQAADLIAANLVLGEPNTALTGNLPASGTILMFSDVRDAFTQRDTADQCGNITLTDAGRALVMSNFGATNPLQIRLAAVEVGPAGDRIELQVAGRDLGSQGVPEIAISGKLIFVTLDTDAAGGGADATTAQQLIDALRAEAGSLIEVSLLWGDADEVLGRDPVAFPYLYSPLILRGGDDVAVKAGYVGLPNGDPGEWQIAFHGRFHGRDLPAFTAEDANLSLASTLSQATDQILVYFNDDDLHTVAGTFTVGDGTPPATVFDPDFYQLQLIRDTVRNIDDVVYRPTQISYDPVTDIVVLGFGVPLTELVDPQTGQAIGGATYRLRIGTNETLPLVPRRMDIPLTVAQDPGSRFATARDLSIAFHIGLAMEVLGNGGSFTQGQTFPVVDSNGVSTTFQFLDNGQTADPGNVAIDFSSAPPSSQADMQTAIRTAVESLPVVTTTVNGNRIYVNGVRSITLGQHILGLQTGSEALVISQEIRNATSSDPPYLLDSPGWQTEPGHRQIQNEQHTNAGPDTTAGVRTLFYHFNKTNPYDVDLDGNPLYNAITVEQEQRAREILDIYSNLLGVQFVETESTGIWIKTGQFGLQVWLQFQEPSRPGGIRGVGGPSGILMDIAENWDNAYNGDWFDVAFHELGHTLGLGHTYELPPGTVMGSESRLGFGQGTEHVWPGLQDLVHGRMLHRPESKDIDIYRFEVPADVFGTLTAETIAERLLHSSSLDTLLRLYRENTDGTTELLAQNAAYFSRDSYLELELGPGVYYIGVSASGNDAYDPAISDSGYGGTSEGPYELKLNFRPAVEASIVDLSDTPLDGNLDGIAGGVFDFWFQTRPHERAIGITGDGRAYVDGQVLTIEDAFGNIRRFEFDSDGNWISGRIQVPFQAGATPTPANQMATDLADLINGSGLVGVTATVDGTRIVLTGERSAMLSTNALGLVLAGKTIFVDKTGGMNLKGTLDRPFQTISSAFGAAVPGDIVRIVGNGGLDGQLGTQGDNHAYEIGTGMLQDGSTMEVPRGVTTMIDAGALFKLRSARIVVGSSPSSIDRSNASLQVLGIPDQRVIFTSYNDESLGVDTNPLPTVPERGDWGGIEFRRDVDVANGQPLPARQGIFLDHVNHAQVQYGGGQVQVDSDLRVVNPIHIIDARPTVTFNVLTQNADAAGYQGAISAQSAAVTIGADGRITLNNLPAAPNPFAGRRLYRSSDGGATYTLVAELDKTRPTYVDTGVAMGGVFPSSSLLATINRPRTDGRLVVDPGAVVKLQASRIEAKFGSYLIAEGTGGYEVIFTSRQDDRYGAGGTFDTNDDVKFATDGNPNTTPSSPQPGNGGGIYVGPMGSLSMDQSLVSYAGGVTTVGGSFSGFNAVELHQPKLARITNSKLERNAPFGFCDQGIIERARGRGCVQL